jgi:hypothetical protein
MHLAKCNRVQLIWMRGHKDVVGNGTANQLAKLGSKCLLIGSEPACGISVGVAKKAGCQGLDNQRPYKILESINRTQTGKGTHTRTKYLLKLNRK